jgi:hypothetical protein
MDISYNFTQATPAITWTVTHNLGRKPVSDVMINFNGRLQKMLPLSVVYVNDNQLQINFTSAHSGKVRLV